MRFFWREYKNLKIRDIDVIEDSIVLFCKKYLIVILFNFKVFEERAG